MKMVNLVVLGGEVTLSEPVARNSMHYCNILMILRCHLGGSPLTFIPFHGIPPISGIFHEIHLKWGIVGIWGGKTKSR